MKAPIYVRALSPEELERIEAGLRSSDAFTLRRSQILLASSRKQRPSKIAQNLGCATQTVRNAIHAFEEKGVACLMQESSRPKTVQAQFDQAKCEALRALLHQSPWAFGKPTANAASARGVRPARASLREPRSNAPIFPQQSVKSACGRWQTHSLFFQGLIATQILEDGGCRPGVRLSPSGGSSRISKIRSTTCWSSRGGG